MSAASLPPILLAAGGTGGHFFPAEALARTLRERGRFVILATDQRGATLPQSLAGIELRTVAAASPSGGSPLSRAQAGLTLARGYLDARRILAEINPGVVVGFGGYASVPTLLAAGHRRIPVVLHEQNAVLGRANRLFATGAAAIATAFAEVRGIPARAAQRVVLTGNPVRAPFVAARAGGYRGPASDGPHCLMVVGGSQGARRFGQVVPEAIAQLPDALRDRLVLVQQCRPEDLEAVRARYRALGIAADLSAFFADVAERLIDASLVIARAGASTVTELAVVGRPAILVPYPYAADDHQTANAAAVAARGAGWMIADAALTAEALAALLTELLTSPARLADAAAAAHRSGLPGAVGALADLVERVLTESLARAAKPMLRAAL